MMQMTIAVVFAAAFATSGAAQDFIAQSGAPAAAFPKPDRPVADIVSPIWHDEKERDDAGEPSQLVRLLGIKSGMTVADIGAGSGYYVVRLSPVVGSKGRIIAEDIVPKYLQSLRARVRKLGLQNVVISLGEAHDPKLPADSVDIVDAFAPTSKHGTPPGLLRCELAAVGYREISFDRLIGSDAYLAIFAPPSVASRTRPEAIIACKVQ